MRIRRATVADVADIAAVHVASWQTTYPGIVDQESITRRSLEVRTEQWERALRGETRLEPMVFVAENDDGEVAGFVSGGPIRVPRTGFDAELYAIYLIKAAQRTGVGRGLVERLVTALARENYASLVVEVLADNPACRFYERLGAALIEENDHRLDDRPYRGRLYGWSDISIFAPRFDDRLNECAWPPLAPRYDAALRDAVAFVFDVVDPVAIAATGTIVRGTAHATSDLDIYVVHDAPYRRRVQRFFNGVPAEIFINPPVAIRSYFHEEHAAARPLTAHMLDTGVVVWSSGTVIDELRTEAHDWLGRTSLPSPGDLVRSRYAIATRFEDALDVAEVDPATSQMLMSQAVTEMLELASRVRSGRLPRGKDLLASITAMDAKLGALAATFFSEAPWSEQRKAAETIADQTIGVRGFFEWDSGPGSVPNSPTDAT
ncbi:MAG: GNAT family N-acetyltransferase [bacterium]